MIDKGSRAEVLRIDEIFLGIDEVARIAAAEAAELRSQQLLLQTPRGEGHALLRDAKAETLLIQRAPSLVDLQTGAVAGQSLGALRPLQMKEGGAVDVALGLAVEGKVDVERGRPTAAVPVDPRGVVAGIAHRVVVHG